MKPIKVEAPHDLFKESKNLSSNRMGDLAEYYAITLFWDYGWEVFRNCGCDGPVDLIVIDDKGKVRLIDIKTRPKKGGRSLGDRKGHHRTDLQKKLGIQVVEFDTDTRKLRFVEHRE